MAADVKVQCQYCGHMFKVWVWGNSLPSGSACEKCKSGEKYLKAFFDNDPFGYGTSLDYLNDKVKVIEPKVGYTNYDDYDGILMADD